MKKITYIGKYKRAQFRIYDTNYSEKNLSKAEIKCFESFKQNLIKDHGSAILITINILPINENIHTAYINGECVYSGISFIDAILIMKNKIGIENSEIIKKLPKKYQKILEEEIKNYKKI